MNRLAILTTAFFFITSFSYAQVSDPTPRDGKATFEGLGFIFEPSFPFDPYSAAYGVSSDGSVITGVTSSVPPEGFPVPMPTYEAFRWENGEMTGLGDLIGGTTSIAYGISADGSTIVGGAAAASGNEEAFRWQDGKMIGLGMLENHATSRAQESSSDGAVIVGISYSDSGNNPEAFRWEAGAMSGLGFLPGGSFSAARGISPDGSIIVGESDSPEGFQAVFWNADGITALGVLPGDDFASIASAVSADGSTIVGVSSSANATDSPPLGGEAFRWKDGVMEGLGDLPGGIFFSSALAVSGDGSVVVGWGFSASGFRAFIWTEGGGMQDLKTYLMEEYDLDIGGWILDTAYGISPDGRFIVGLGYNPNGKPEAWRVALPPLGETGPENDHIADATVIPVANATYSGTNVNATLEDSEPEPSCTFSDWTTNFSVWWTFTADDEANHVNINTFDSDFDTILSIHRADDLSEVACDDDTNGLQSQIEDAPIVAGETYLIRVAGYDQSSANQGDVQLTVEFHTVSGEPGSEAFVTSLTAPSPNPVRGTASFSLTVDREQSVTVEVFDLMGRRVQTLYSGSLIAGAEESLTLNASSLSSGMYIIRATGEDFLLTQRVTVIR